MKVVLLAFSGDEAFARAILQSSFSGAKIETISRASIEAAGFPRSLKLLRALQPEIFATSLENLTFQRGQNLLSLFAALTGAHEVLAVDARGHVRRETRAGVLLRSPFRLLYESWLSAVAILQSHHDLTRLEKAVKYSTRKSLKSERAAHVFETPKIVFLRAHPGPGTHTGGASSHINGFINAATREGARICLVTNDHIAGLDETKFPLTLIPLESTGITRSAFDLRNNLVFTRRAVSEVAKTQPAFIYQRYSRFTWAGVAAGIVTGRPLFLEYNGSEVWIAKYWDGVDKLPFLKRVERLNLEAATRIFVVSEVERRNLLSVGIADEKIVVNPNGVDVEKFRPNVGEGRARANLGFGDDDVVVGFVGSFGPWHGVLELAQAITLIPPNASLRFLFVGTGKLREQTEAIIRNAGTSERVIFTDAVAHERVPEFLDACDILVSPHVPLEDGSEFFGSPTKIFEYMAMEKGIVASRLGQLGEILTHEETALLIRPGDVAGLSKALLSLAGSPELRERLGKRARRIVEENYTWTHNAERVLRTYESLFHQT